MTDRQKESSDDKQSWVKTEKPPNKQKNNYYCPVNVFKSFKIQYLSNYKPQFIIKTNLSQ